MAAPKDYKRQLTSKGWSAERHYKRHIKQFREKMGTGVSFVQADIDDYWARLQKEDARPDNPKPESESLKR